MNIRTQDGRTFSGTPLQVVQHMRDASVMAAHMTVRQYAEFVAQNAGEFDGASIAVEGATDKEVAEGLLAALILAGLAEQS